MAAPSLRIGFVGAGNVNFGGCGLPWDHATRLEKIGGVAVVGIADLDQTKAAAVLQKRLASEYSQMYKDCKIYGNVDDLLSQKLDAIIIGIPPVFRGSSDGGRDLELRCVRAGVHVFVEKPLSVAPPEDFYGYSQAVEEAAKEKGVIVSVGYMFRYHDAIEKMRSLISDHGGKVMAFNARYYFAYTKNITHYSWNSKLGGGPIVEQATHFCDLARHLVGDIQSDSINTLMLNETDPGGSLRHIPLEVEANIAPEDRIPRVTMSHWRFKHGGVGTLMHSIAIPGDRYETNIDVQMDGLKMALYEPYTSECVLRVRKQSSSDPNEDEVYHFGEADPYEKELRAFISAVRSKDSSGIQSSYTDATKTYLFTWDIWRKGKQ